MKAIIYDGGIELDGTPTEISEVMNLVDKENPKSVKKVITRKPYVKHSSLSILDKAVLMIVKEDMTIAEAVKKVKGKTADGTDYSKIHRKLKELGHKYKYSYRKRT